MDLVNTLLPSVVLLKVILNAPAELMQTFFDYSQFGLLMANHF